MSNIPKTHVRRTLFYGIAYPLFKPTRNHWEVTLGGTVIAEFDNHPDALTYAHRRATTAQRQHVEKLERAAYEARRAAEKAAGKRRMTAENGTPEKRVQMHNAEQIKEFAEHTGLHLSEWQIIYLNRLLQKGHP